MLKESGEILKNTISQKDISFLMFCASVFLLPFSINISTLTFILAIIFKFIQAGLKRNKFFESKALKHSSIIGIVFFGYIFLNTIIQTSFEQTINVFEKQFSHWTLLFLTPILLRGKRENKLILAAFFSGTILAVLYVLSIAIINKITFDKYAFLNLLELHHTYLSMYLLVFVNYCFVQLIIRKRAIKNSIGMSLVIAVLLSLAVMYFLNSKVAMIIFLLVFLIHSIPELTKKHKWIYALILVFILTIITVFNNKVNVNYERALDFRLQVWEMSLNVFEESPFFGNSTKSEKDLLNYKHFVKGKYQFVDSDLNSHNQYLSILMKYGVLGFVILAFFAINIFNKTNKRTSKKIIREFMGFMAIMLMIFYIENLLDRHHGIVFCTLFYNYYLIAIENE